MATLEVAAPVSIPTAQRIQGCVQLGATADSAGSAPQLLDYMADWGGQEKPNHNRQMDCRTAAAPAVEKINDSSHTANPASELEKDKAGAAETAAGLGNAYSLELVTSTLDPDKWARCAAFARAFNALTAAEQRDFAVALAPAVLDGGGWPEYAMTAMLLSGAHLPEVLPVNAHRRPLPERKWIMKRVWDTLSNADRASFLRKHVAQAELRKAQR